jgi:stage II sporulation protein D
VRNGRYRGRVRLAASRPGVLEVVNIVGLEQYLRGVVPGEVPASWGDDAPAAVRAQAIAARTFALATRKEGGRFDLFSDVRSQVYRGIGIEDPRTDEAIKKTKGMIITYEGEPIVANFSSTSGGQTASASTIWEGVDRPYLVSVNDPFDRVSPFHRWPEPVEISGADLGAALGLGGPVMNMQILSTGRSPRVTRVEVETEGGARSVVSGPQIRTAAGLRSTWFTFTRQPSREA